MILISKGLLAQITISGTVTDDNNKPIPGANIVIKGTSTGTVTNLEGIYTLENIPSGSVLVFSFVGMLSEEIRIDNQTQIDMMLIPDIMDLESVVVIGYGSVKKKDLTGAVSSVKTDEITKLPTSNPIEALQGKVTGMDIVRSSGSAGSGVKVTIRGNTTITTDNEPLYVVDGVQGASINDINPNDIESISVLKDAASTAIYGWQGAQGVVIITTKKGSTAQSKVSYNGYYGINGYPSYPSVRLRDEYIDFRKEAYRSGGIWDPDVHNESNYNLLFNEQDLAAIDSGQWINWQDEIIQNGRQQSHQISHSGGNEKTTSYFSAGYFQEKGTLKNDEIVRYSAKLNVDHSASKWLKIGLQSQIAYYEIDRRKDPLSTANSISPLGEAYDDDGNIILYPIAVNTDQISPLTDERPDIAVNNTLRTNALINGYLEIKPINGLIFRSNMGTNIRFSRKGVFNDATSLSSKNSLRTTASVENDGRRFINWDNILSYSKLIDNHSISLTALSSYTLSISDFFNASGLNQTNPKNLFYKLGATDSEGRNISSGYTKRNTLSFAGRLNYTYDDKYIISLTNRYDGASMLTEGNKWDNFPSVSVAWKINEEDFLINSSLINNLKLRGSYGIAGNANIDAYDTQSLIWPFAVGFGEVANTAYKFEDLIGSEALGWEKSKTVNIGLDFGILNSRINATIDVYDTKTDDILLERQLPRMTGVQSIMQNIGSTRNRGVEILLNSANIQTSDFRWTSTFTFSRNKEEITDLIDGQDIIYSEENSLVIGHPIETFYTFKKLGLWQEGEEEDWSIYPFPIKAGDIKLEDLNNDSIYDADDRTVIGHRVPNWIAGFENTFTYKSFDLTIYLFARWGQMIDAEFLGRYNPSGEGNGPAYLDFWTPENPSNDFPRPLSGSLLSNYFGYQTLTYVDGSYFKIKNVRLAYTLPQSVTQKAFIDRLQVYVTASNLLTVTKSHLIKYYDPERGGSESAPLSKQFIFGLNVDF